MQFKIRVCNGCDPKKIAGARIVGGPRGFGKGINALELMSNDMIPTLRSFANFVLIYEPQYENTH